MVLLKTPIPGYNNLLRESSETNMTFGYNSELNFKSVKKDKKTHTDGGEHLGELDHTTKNSKTKKSPEKSNVVLSIVLVASGMLVSKYIL